MKIKKIPFYLLVLFFTLGAALVAGLLSFGGSLVLWPILWLACTAGILAVLYEGTVFWKNIKESLNRLMFKPDYFTHTYGKKFLLECLLQYEAEKKLLLDPGLEPAHLHKHQNWPNFFKDYQNQLDKLKPYRKKSLDKASKTEKKHIERTLNDMEKWFSDQLLNKPLLAKDDQFEQELRCWLAANGQEEQIRQFQTANQYNLLFILISIIAGCFMALSTPALIATITSTALFASFTFPPLLIVIASLMAGFGYAFLIYNSISQMYEDKTLGNWWHRIAKDCKNKRFLFPLGSVVLILLALALTICTAGTWWTIAGNPKGPLPRFVMAIINPIAMFFTAIIFNLQNLANTLKVNKDKKPHHHKSYTAPFLLRMVNKIESFFEKIFSAIKIFFTELWERENILQILNPFRLLLIIVVVPLKIVLFLAHLLSMSVDSNRMPSFSEIFATILSFIMEFFIDYDYVSFKNHNHNHSGNEEVSPEKLLQERLSKHHSHDHDNDIPSWLIFLGTLPIRGLATLWDKASIGIENFIDRYLKKRAFKQEMKQEGKVGNVICTINKDSFFLNYTHINIIEPREYAHKKNISWKKSWLKQLGKSLPEKINVRTEDRLSSGWRATQRKYRTAKETKKMHSGCFTFFCSYSDEQAEIKRRVDERVAPSLRFVS